MCLCREVVPAHCTCSGVCRALLEEHIQHELITLSSSKGPLVVRKGQPRKSATKHLSSLSPKDLIRNHPYKNHFCLRFVVERHSLGEQRKAVFERCADHMWNGDRLARKSNEKAILEQG